MKYIVFSDLDDTLLTSNKQITLESINYIKEFVNNGNIFCIATGRPFDGAYKFYEALNVNCPLVCDNGASIYFLDGKNHYFSLDKNILKEFLIKTEDMADCIYINTNNNIAYSHNLNNVPGWLIHNEYSKLQIIDGIIHENINEDGLICNFWLQERYLDSFMKILEEYDFFYRNWGLYDGIYAFEIHSKEASKGNALLYLANYFNIPHKNTLAFGDQLNDISMLKEAYYGVSMINANTELKELTKYHTDYDFNNNGVIEFLKKLPK